MSHDAAYDFVVLGRNCDPLPAVVSEPAVTKLRFIDSAVTENRAAPAAAG
jgi:hypothetical protein